MSEQKHTPELWTTTPFDKSKAGWLERILFFVMNIYKKRTPGHVLLTDHVNAQRIVACVNACKGISNEALEAGVIKDLIGSLSELPAVARLADQARAKMKAMQ